MVIYNIHTEKVTKVLSMGRWEEDIEAGQRPGGKVVKQTVIKNRLKLLNNTHVFVPNILKKPFSILSRWHSWILTDESTSGTCRFWHHTVLGVSNIIDFWEVHTPFSIKSGADLFLYENGFTYFPKNQLSSLYRILMLWSGSFPIFWWCSATVERLLAISTVCSFQQSRLIS